MFNSLNNQIFNSLIVSNPSEELRLREENEDDNVEYKLRLDSKTKFGRQKLMSQLNYRLEIGRALTGKKEAHYVLGIRDDGHLGKLTESEIDETFSIFSNVVNTADVTITYIDKKQYNDSYLIYAIVQKIESFKIKEINIAFVGPSQHGKTTTVSHLVYGQHDDGNGYARKLVFKHEHEKVSGVTSSIKKEIVGLNKGNIINYSIGISTGWQDIVEMSEKVINLIDLPGNLKYFKSTFFGLSTYKIDGIAIVVDVKKESISDWNEITFYKLFARTFNIPYTFLIINDNNAIYEKHCYDGDDMIEISNLSNHGFDKVVQFLDKIEIRNPIVNNVNPDTNINPLFCVMETYSIPDTGTIFSGIMKYGSLSLGDSVYLTNGQTYRQTKIKSIHRKLIDSKTLYEGETGAIQLEFDTRGLPSGLGCASNLPSGLGCASNLPEVNKHMIITTVKLSTYDEFLFTLLNENQNKTMIRSGQKCLMFVDNIVTHVYITIVNDKFNLKSENKIIIPSLDQECVAFLKCDGGVLFGKLQILNI